MGGSGSDCSGGEAEARESGALPWRDTSLGGLGGLGGPPPSVEIAPSGGAWARLPVREDTGERWC